MYSSLDFHFQGHAPYCNYSPPPTQALPPAIPHPLRQTCPRPGTPPPCLCAFSSCRSPAPPAASRFRPPPSQVPVHPTFHLLKVCLGIRSTSMNPMYHASTTGRDVRHRNDDVKYTHLFRRVLHVKICFPSPRQRTNIQHQHQHIICLPRLATARSSCNFFVKNIFELQMVEQAAVSFQRRTPTCTDCTTSSGLNGCPIGSPALLEYAVLPWIRRFHRFRSKHTGYLAGRWTCMCVTDGAETVARGQMEGIRDGLTLRKNRK